MLTKKNMFTQKNINEHTLLGLIIDTNVNWIEKIRRNLSSTVR